ncbi:unnamed protein product [Medioppia subpectinata]|uniref:Uncharacterized protein n=1 Tax=Medioppia subpectinata TaxID=1979941 RepID=A0A7R9Q593_9ACAR|nr:unnamed protein product [Medioppia subpectinata]CAG2113099.1 unnamed protein product [Medioppia subpectinata]
MFCTTGYNEANLTSKRFASDFTAALSCWPNLTTITTLCAPNSTAFILTSRSMGKVIPKWSASVNHSRPKPDHCLVITPTREPSLADHTGNSTSPQVRLAVIHGDCDRRQ